MWFFLFYLRQLSTDIFRVLSLFFCLIFLCFIFIFFGLEKKGYNFTCLYTDMFG